MSWCAPWLRYHITYTHNGERRTLVEHGRSEAEARLRFNVWRAGRPFSIVSVSCHSPSRD